MQSFSGTMPYQQLPSQLGWSQRRTPPRLRFVRGVAVVVVARRRAVRRALKEVEGIVGFDGVELLLGLDVGLLAKVVGSRGIW
jgi:hypothetical protein